MSIASLLPALRAALTDGRAAVLEAPPGTGKSTVVPLALLDEPWLGDGRILMLEPRRLAARAVARRMADTLDEPVGRTVGYRMRLDTRVSSATRIEVLTEGVLSRMLSEDPALDGVALVIFDEFHERSLQADLGLALTLDARDVLNPDLRVLVMSATLDGEAVTALLGDAARIAGEGRPFPVTTHYAAQGAPLLPGASMAATSRTTESVEQRMARITLRALAETEGDVLVFLPGAAEIRRTQQRLEQALRDDTSLSATTVLPLFGDLDSDAQDAALSPSAPGRRRVVLATNIAETSLTIDGIRVVVDSGLVRRAVFDPVTGMSRLTTRRISRASAEQRQGRAGRTAPGHCYRAWSEGAHQSLAATTPPEIVEADLAPLALELANWGTPDASTLRWLDAPPAAMLASARDLLRRLGAIDDDGRITAEGRDMCGLGLHPRLAHMLLAARRSGAASLGARIAALLSDHDALRGGRRDDDPDLTTRLHRSEGHDPASRRVRRLADELLRRIEQGRGRGQAVSSPQIDELTGVLLAFAYPDRIARRRSGGESRYTLANGRGAKFSGPSALARAPYIVAVDVDDRDRDGLIRLAAALTREAMDIHFGEQLRSVESVAWDAREQAVIARTVLRLGDLVLEEKPLPRVPPDAAASAMLDGVRMMGLQSLPWTDAPRDLQARILFARRVAPETPWPAVDDAALTATVDGWLAPWLAGCTRREHLARVPLAEALRAMLTYEQSRQLEQLAPTHLPMPSGSRIRVDYRSENAPVVAVRLQEVFGLHATPRLGGGRAPVTFELLSPARRPVQITQDLASFWANGYADVRRDLRGRYPKHDWPEDPLEAKAISGVRRRGS